MELLLAGLTFLAVGLLLLSAFVLLGGAKREDQIRTRLEAIEKGTRRGNTSRDLTFLRDELLSEVPILNRLLLHWSWSARLQKVIGQAGLRVRPGKLVLASGILALGGYLAVGLLHSTPLLPLIAGVTTGLAPFLYVMVQRSRRLRKFEKNFTEAIDLLSRSVRAGHTFTTALELIGTELPEPVSGEFRTTFDEQNFGLPLRDALLNLTERVPLLDVRFFVTALLIQKETGGNLAEILDNLSHVIRERFKIVGDVRVRTAQGRLTAGILIALPPLMLLMLRFVNPDYINLLFKATMGHYMLLVAGGLQVVGALLLWRIVNIEV